MARQCPGTGEQDSAGCNHGGKWQDHPSGPRPEFHFNRIHGAESRKGARGRRATDDRSRSGEKQRELVPRCNRTGNQPPKPLRVDPETRNYTLIQTEVRLESTIPELVAISPDVK